MLATIAWSRRSKKEIVTENKSISSYRKKDFCYYDAGTMINLNNLNS